MKTALVAMLGLFLPVAAAIGEEPAPAAAATAADPSASLVFVEVFLAKRDDLPRSMDDMGAYSDRSWEQERRRNLGAPIEMQGVVVGAGEVLVSDPRLAPEDVGEIFATAADGKRTPLTIAGVLSHAPGLLLAGDPAALPPPVSFAEPPELRIGLPIGGYWLARWFDEFSVQTAQIALDGRLPDGGFLTRARFQPGTLLVDAENRPIGVALGEWLYAPAPPPANGGPPKKGEDGPADDFRGTFLGRRLLRMPGLSGEELGAKIAAVREKVGAAVVRVRLEYRLPERDEDDGMYSSFDAGPGEQQESYGLHLGGGRVFLPIDPGFQKIRQLARVVALRDEADHVAETEGSFLGTFKDWAGILLQFPDLAAAPAAEFGAPAAERFELFFTGVPERKFGRDELKVRPIRWNGDELARERGKSIRRPRFDLQVAPGSFLADAAGRVTGFFAAEKHEEAAAPAGYSMFGQEEPVIRLFWMEEVKPTFAEPAAAFDPRAAPMSRLEAKRGVWLGVEFQFLDQALSRELGIQGPTRDGERGLLVNLVYPDSPAAAAGIRVGDVLLYALEDGKPETEKKEFQRQQSYYSFRVWGGGYSFDRGSFPARTNELTRLLTTIGEGKKVRLVWLREGAEAAAEIELGRAPADFQSAPKWEDKPLGLTVRELTYEVRHYYRLPADAGGVVVARVESGTAAEVAEVRVQDVVERVNGRPVAGLAEFRKAVEEARAAGGEGLTLFVRRLGGTRFIEVRFAPEAEAEEPSER